MRDLHDENEVQRLLIACVSGGPVDLEAHLHPQFMAVGVEDGLFIAADRPTYMSFMARLVPRGLPLPRIDWIDVRDRIATGCIVQEDAQIRRTIVVTLLCDAAGWRVMTATFSCGESEATAAPPVRLQ